MAIINKNNNIFVKNSQILFLIVYYFNPSPSWCLEEREFLQNTLHFRSITIIPSWWVLNIWLEVFERNLLLYLIESRSVKVAVWMKRVFLKLGSWFSLKQNWKLVSHIQGFENSDLNIYLPTEFFLKWLD